MRTARKRAGREVLKILIDACARYMGRTKAEYWRAMAISDVACVQAQAIADGLEALPLTARERAALRRLRFDPDTLKGAPDYEVERILEGVA